MKLLNNLEKAIITNYMQRQIIDRDIPATCTLDVKMALVSGKVKSIEIIPKTKEKK